MLWTILAFELKHWFTDALFYIYAGVLFLLALGTMAGSAGFFGEGSSGVAVANSPHGIYSLSLLFSRLLVLLIPAVVGVSIHRDFSSNSHSFLYAYPFTKFDYLFAKFSGGALAVIFLSLTMLAGLAAGVVLPGVNHRQVLPFDAGVYVHTFFVYLAPNLLVGGALVFAVVATTRNIYSGFVLVFVLLLTAGMFSRILPDGMAGAIVDPFGETATQELTRNWTPSERGGLPLQVSTALLVNRLLWLLVAASVFIFAFRSFKFEEGFSPWRLRRGTHRLTKRVLPDRLMSHSLPRVTREFSLGHSLRTVWRLSQSDFLHILRSGSFIAVLVVGAVLIALLLLNINPQTDARIIPVTWIVLSVPMLFFGLLVQGLTFLYAGVLVHRARAARMVGLVDATPTPDSVFIAAQLLSVVKMQIVLLLLAMVVGLSIELYAGSDQLDIGHYVFDLFCIHLPGFVIWGMAAIALHTMVGNPFAGFFALVVIAFGIEQLPNFGIASPAIRFNQTPDPTFFLKYSDMNGHHHALGSFFVYKFYWLLHGLLLGGVAVLFRNRELVEDIAERFRTAKSRLRGGIRMWMSSLFPAVVVFALVLLQIESKPENVRLTSAGESEHIERFRNVFGHLETTPQPRITSLSFSMNIFPDQNRFDLTGRYTLVNKGAVPVETLLVKSGYDELTSLHFPQGVTTIGEDSVFKFTVYRLEAPLAPGDSMMLSFSVRNKPNTILVRYSNVLRNGTHIKSDIFPRMGYFAEGERALPGNTGPVEHHYQGRDADVIAFEATISTSAHQYVIAPGTLEDDWFEGQRRHFRFKTETDIKFVFSVLSGEYALMRDTCNGVDLRIYHHPGHTYSLEGMMSGLKGALLYNTAGFAPYPYKIVQVVEFPRSEGTYATMAGNCIPVSEIRFISDPRGPEEGEIDIAFYVVAHELGHQWWGNLLLPGDVAGATMLTESITEYITTQIYQERHGRAMARKFLDLQLERYLNGRTRAAGTEPPLKHVQPDQSYIAYGKGAIAFHTLARHIGESQLNGALRTFVINEGRSHPPYPTSEDLILYLRAATPDSLQYLITDLFETAGPEKLVAAYIRASER